MALDWSPCPAVKIIPGKVSGAWVFRGTACRLRRALKTSGVASIEEIVAVRRNARKSSRTGICCAA